MNLNTFLQRHITKFEEICASFKSNLRIFLDIKNISSTLDFESMILE
jgi:hypothetical protein